ncbi:hypothetical protein HPB47_024482, partial [Ixodes persulcatus]
MAQSISNAEGSDGTDSRGTSGKTMDSLKPPETLRLTGNSGENWRRIEQRWEIYLKATEFALKADD